MALLSGLIWSHRRLNFLIHLLVPMALFWVSWSGPTPRPSNFPGPVMGAERGQLRFVQGKASLWTWTISSAEAASPPVSRWCISSGPALSCLWNRARRQIKEEGGVGKILFFLTDRATLRLVSPLGRLITWCSSKWCSFNIGILILGSEQWGKGQGELDAPVTPNSASLAPVAHPSWLALLRGSLASLGFL